MNSQKSDKLAIERWIIEPVQHFIHNSTTGGIVLFSSAILALLLSNSPWAEDFHHLWEIEFGFTFNGKSIEKSLHHWINDGLMAVFFFVVGLELKREIVAGELRNPRKALLPLTAALGGMVLPAIIYLFFNKTGESSNGWGIPMATDIAFALGVLYLLGDKVPLSLKVFLTALAIVDDLGAVLVIAFFYTSHIDFVNLATGFGFMAVLVVANLAGVRSTLFYGIVGIAGMWLAFLMSGVHATIAAVLAAMTIPAEVRFKEREYLLHLKQLTAAFEEEEPNNIAIVTPRQLQIIERIRSYSKKAATPLQRLEHNMHPLVAFIIMPLFAFSNAGVTFSSGFLESLMNPVFFGVFLGLLVGKVVGVFGLSLVLIKTGWLSMPENTNFYHLLGVGFLAAIGFTMSLFISGLAFESESFIEQTKMGILFASVLASFVGYFIIRFANSQPVKG